MYISIVVPFYNEEKHVEGCIKALLSQNYPADQYEIIMIDNNSTDRSVEIVRKYPRIKLYKEQEQGDFAARNRGIVESKGEIIAFTDSDTAPLDDWLQNIAKAMIDPKIGIIIGGLQFSPNSKSLSMMADYESEKAVYIFSGNTKEIYFGYTCNMIVRKSLFDRLGPFPKIYRNSDIVFVQQVVDKYSCEAVRYSTDVCVRRLEVSSLFNYYSKQLIYGQDFQRYSKFASARPLNTIERIRIFKKTIKRNGYSIIKSILLFATLVAGVFYYEFGRIKKVRPKGTSSD